jgi:hypothetical protein
MTYIISWERVWLNPGNANLQIGVFFVALASCWRSLAVLVGTGTQSTSRKSFGIRKYRKCLYRSGYFVVTHLESTLTKSTVPVDSKQLTEMLSLLE